MTDSNNQKQTIMATLNIDDGSSSHNTTDEMEEEEAPVTEYPPQSTQPIQSPKEQEEKEQDETQPDHSNESRAGLMASLISSSSPSSSLNDANNDANSTSLRGPQRDHAVEEENGDTHSTSLDDSTEWLTVEQAMERLGVGWFQYKILIASGLCFAADAMQVILLSFLTLVLKEEWSLSNAQTESITSCLFAGAFLGTLILGPAADRVGRRPLFLIAASIISVFGLGTAMASTYAVFMILIFFVGFGVGGLVVPFDLLAEFLPSAGRGRMLLSIQYFWTFGCLYVVVMAYITLHGRPKPTHDNDNDDTSPSALELTEFVDTSALLTATTGGAGHHWRAFIAYCTLPCIFSLVIGYFYVPESALWLASEGETEQALEVLRKAAVANGHEDPYVMFPPNLEIRKGESHKDASIAELFRPEWREITLRLWGTWLAFAFGYYGTLLAITRVFEKHNTSKDSSASDTYDFDYGAIFLSSAAELVGTSLVLVLVDTAGRIPSQTVCYFMAGICVGLLCVLAEWDYPHLVLVVLGFAARVFEMGATCTTWVSTAEILTTEVRSTGHSTANAMARIGAFFCPFLVEGDTPLAQIGVIFLLVHMFTVFCVCKLPETKGKAMGAGPARREELGDGTEEVTFEGEVL